ncbi:right-handed parallel beta-helix repeat-containing protein [Candidatus Desantisbacteria bacterium]|nr:right-handed parallel beta-helix repeat-containing protein [Candidatus Desantisbacteria bacterium]
MLRFFLKKITIIYKHKYTIVCFFLISVFYFFIQGKSVSGHAISNEARYIKQDETWNGTISILDDTVIEENATLNINAGTKIIFYISSPLNPPRIIVKGKLLVNGKKEEKVLFTSSQEAILNPVEEEEKNSISKTIINFFAKKKSSEIKLWGGIHFDKIGENGSIVSYSIIEFAKDGIVLLNSSPSITFSTIRNCGQSGIRCNLRSNPRIISNVFEKNSYSGIYCHQESFPEISNNFFKGLSCGIYCYQSAPKIIANNIFEKNQKGIYCGLPGASTDITGNKFTDNENGIFCEQSASPIIERNIFFNNKHAIYCQRLASPNIVENEFNKNEYAVFCFQNSSPLINNNKFTFNKIGIYLKYASYPNINKNFLDESNDYAVKIDKQSHYLYQELMFNTSGKYRMGRGAYSPEKQEKRDEKFKFNKQKKFEGINTTINAKNNYWGEKVTKEMIKNKKNVNIKTIWDGFDEPEFEFEGKKYPQDKVDYSEWLDK